MRKIRTFGKSRLRILYVYAYMRIKFLLSLVCFILPFTEHAYFSMRIYACVFFYAWQRMKYGHGMRVFQAFNKESCLRCDVTRLLSVMIMVLAFENV